MRTAIFVGCSIIAEAICQSNGLQYKTSEGTTHLAAVIFALFCFADIIDLIRDKR